MKQIEGEKYYSQMEIDNLYIDKEKVWKEYLSKRVCANEKALALNKTLTVCLMGMIGMILAPVFFKLGSYTYASGFVLILFAILLYQFITVKKEIKRLEDQYDFKNQNFLGFLKMPDGINADK